MLAQALLARYNGYAARCARHSDAARGGPDARAAKGIMGEPYAGLVLLVDGDTALRRAMRDFLMQSGCAVLEARDAYDGLFICAQYGTAINLLITEINLLPVGGIKLAENALRLWPKLQVLCMSADAEPGGVQYWMKYLNAQYLPKPFQPFQLHEKVFSLLGRRLEDAPMPILDAPPQDWMRDARKHAAPVADTQAEPRRTSMPTRWDAFRPHADMSKPASSGRDPLFWLKEF
jgi:CheY-like chemotaxis protein